MTITPERLAELRTYVTTLWRRCRANPRPEVGEEANLEDLLTLLEQRGMTSAEAGEIYPLHERIQGVYTRQGRAAVCGIPDDSHNCDQMACSSVEHVLARVPHIVDEKPCATCDGEPRGVLIDVVSGKPVKPLERTYGAEWRPCPDCGERKAVVDGLRGVVRILRGGLNNESGAATVESAIALLSQEELSDEQRAACKLGAACVEQFHIDMLSADSAKRCEVKFKYAAVLRQLASKP